MEVIHQYKPIYLLADSQLLFCKDPKEALIRSIKDNLQVEKDNITKAAYIGASNHDDPQFFDIFKVAMDGINLHESHLIRSSLPQEDKAFIESADLILLAGGDVSLGWKVIKESGLAEVIVRRYREGALLIGVSAGAVQLGMGYCDDIDDSFTETLRLVPYYIGAHDEKNSWNQLQKTVKSRGDFIKGLGIPFGGGMICHEDSSIEPVKQVLSEFYLADGKVKSNLLLPPTEEAGHQLNQPKIK